ncbi:MAG: hypothetical protein Q4G25_13275 [Paracoccus sp. (in: a-proteobacteria)]|nr:hypothetical protein [Paracoccus sp. (in: a-proteobacteria)]
MKVALFVASLALMPAAGFAQGVTACGDFLAASGIAAPPEGLNDAVAADILRHALMHFAFDPLLLEDIFGTRYAPAMAVPSDGCSAAQLAALTANLGAIPGAQPVSDPAQLYGTWVSDDILTETTGLTVSGREVLVIGPPDADHRPGGGAAISIRQYWFKPVFGHRAPIWDENGEYLGLVTQGTLETQDGHSYRRGLMDAAPDYTDIAFLGNRGEDLFLQARLNHFDQPVDFALNGDTLVMGVERRMPLFFIGKRAEMTYHRTAEGSPEAALRLVTAMGVPAGRYFSCLMRGISGNDPALDVLFAPDGIQGAVALAHDLIRNVRQMDALRAQVRRGEQMSDEDQAVMIAAAERGIALTEQMDPLRDALLAGEICPDPERVEFSGAF